MSELAGTGRLIRLILRRDRWIVPPLYLILLIAIVSFLSSFKKLYPTVGGREKYAHLSMDNGGFTTLYGQLHGSTYGDLVAWRCGFIPVVIALVSLLTVIRHTRTEEETGRRELLGATVVGRHAPLTAAFTTVSVINLLLGAYVALVLAVEGLPVAGSTALGLECAGAGLIFAGVGAVAAQLTASPRGAWSISLTTLSAAFLLRVAGDLSAHADGPAGWVSWLSPIGWAQRLRPYHGEQWWVLLIILGATAVLMATAFTLSNRRDIGSGILPEQPGRPEAAPSLSSPLALAWRLHRSALLGWLTGFVILGAVLGSLAQGIGHTLNDNTDLEKIFQRTGGSSGLVDAYLATIMGILGIFAAGYAIQSTLRMRQEESAGRVEPILATPAGRWQWAASHLLFSVAGPLVALVLAGLSTGLTYGIDNGDMGRELPRVSAAALAEIPAVLVMTALTIALFGLLPRLTALAWAGLGICLSFGLIGSAMELSHWLLDLSPFTHVPHLPGGTVSAIPIVSLLAVAALASWAGIAGFRRRPVG